MRTRARACVRVRARACVRVRARKRTRARVRARACACACVRLHVRARARARARLQAVLHGQRRPKSGAFDYMHNHSVIYQVTYQRAAAGGAARPAETERGAKVALLRRSNSVATQQRGAMGALHRPCSCIARNRGVIGAIASTQPLRRNKATAVATRCCVAAKGRNGGDAARWLRRNDGATAASQQGDSGCDASLRRSERLRGPPTHMAVRRSEP
jgi:hypothetical protein